LDLHRYNTREKKSFIEVLTEFSTCTPSVDYLLDFIPQITPRYFSISSSPSMYPNQIHITVAILKFQTPYKRIRTGFCSTFFSSNTIVPTNSIEQQQQQALNVKVFLKKGQLKLAPLDSNVIMVGPGTGVAPFRSFVQARMMSYEQQQATVGKTVLVFGNRNANKDFLYGAEWEQYKTKSNGSFSLITAFSRDQPDKIYVQHQIEAHASSLWSLMVQKNTYIYVAGNAKQMPTNVRDAFKKIVQLNNNSQWTDEQCEQFMKNLEATGRYQVETWS